MSTKTVAKKSSKTIHISKKSARPAPKLTPAAKKAPPASQKKLSTPRAEKVEKETTESTPIARNMELQALRLLKRFQNFDKRFITWPESIRAANATAITSVTALHTELSNLGDEFRPPRRSGSGGSNGLKEGEKVQVMQRSQHLYEDVLEPSELSNLTVLVVKDGRVRVQSENGNKFVVPRAHLVRLSEAGDSAAEEEEETDEGEEDEGEGEGEEEEGGVGEDESDEDEDEEEIEEETEEDES